MSMWGDSGDPIHIAAGAASWYSFDMLDGLFQGHNLSTLLFCLGLRLAIRRFEQDYSSSECAIAGKPVHFEYIDDLLMKLCPNMAPMWLPLLTSALATVRLRLNLSKTKVWIPSAAHGTLHPQLAQMGLLQVFDNLELMGGALKGQHAASIGSAAVPSASTKRVEQAEILSQCLQTMLHTPLE